MDGRVKRASSKRVASVTCNMKCACDKPVGSNCFSHWWDGSMTQCHVSKLVDDTTLTAETIGHCVTACAVKAAVLTGATGPKGWQD